MTITQAANLQAALSVEAHKTTRSRVVRSATVLIVAGITLIAGSLTAAASGGNTQILAKLGPFATATGWDRLLGIAAQVTAAAALLGFGVTLSWIIGREFADGTVNGLFALPVSPRTIAAAKLLAYLAWTAAVAIALTATLTLTGLVLGLGTPPLDALARQTTLTVLSAGLAVPAAWAASVGRGLLPGITVAIGTIVTAQIAVAAGTGAWMPLAAPALWALAPSQVTPLQLALSLTIPAASGYATLTTWHRLQLDH